MDSVYWSRWTVVFDILSFVDRTGIFGRIRTERLLLLLLLLLKHFIPNINVQQSHKPDVYVRLKQFNRNEKNEKILVYNTYQ